GDEFADVMGAGELPLPKDEHIVAMTFMRLAPFTEPRGDETRHEMLSEITSTVGSVFLGLTVGCAKCHDHKHDEIPTADFYRMKAFFATIQIPPPERGDGFQIGGSLPAKFYRKGEDEWARQRREQIQKENASAGEQLAELKRSVQQRLGAEIATGTGFGIQTIAGGNDYYFAKHPVNDGQPHWAMIRADGNQWTIHSDGEARRLGTLSGSNRGQWFSSLANVEYVSLGQHTAGNGDPSGSGHAGKFAEILIYDHPLDAEETSRVSAYVRGKYFESPEAEVGRLPEDGLVFWLDASDLDANPETPNAADGTAVSVWTDQVARITLSQTDAKLQPKLSRLGKRSMPAVEFDDDFLKGAADQAGFASNNQGTLVMVYSATHNHEGYGFEVGGDGKFLTTFINPGAEKRDELEQLFKSDDDRITSEERQRYQYLSTRGKFVKQHLKRLKPVAMSLRHSFGPPYEPSVPVSRIMIRGEYDNPGDVVLPGFPSVITGNQEPARIRLDPFKRWPTRSRRKALADWIASPANPMTVRVIANRLWGWHFGQGIVRTPSDFGHLSGGPSHQSLLDCLAKKFVEDKWSLKAMHRRIVTSATYRQSSLNPEHATEAARIDPDNRLLWRFSRRRLEAEAIRDSVLFVSGRLNPEQFGLPIFPPLPGDVAERVKYSNSKWDTQYGPEGRKRSIYIYQQRTLTMPLMQTFDSLVCEESRPRRRASVTPLQALAMYNGEFVNEESRFFAARVRDSSDDDIGKQLCNAFEMALGRLPEEAEAATLAELLSTDGLEAVCLVLLNTNEFLYVD
ncbi:MAG: DUF1553 domain-containing protein, partial [Planctomycetota bacterium]